MSTHTNSENEVKLKCCICKTITDNWTYEPFCSSKCEESYEKSVRESEAFLDMTWEGMMDNE